MHCHRILISALFVNMPSLLTSFISKKYFILSLVQLLLVPNSSVDCLFLRLNEYSRKPEFFRYTDGVLPIWRLANDKQIGDSRNGQTYIMQRWVKVSRRLA